MASDLRGLLGFGGQPLFTPPTFSPTDSALSTSGESLAAPLVQHSALEVHGTTVIAVKYKEGVINVGDRRATANFAVMYDRAEKVLAIDDYMLLAISGSFARAMELVRYLRTKFKYFERSQLQPMSLDGKLS